MSSVAAKEEKVEAAKGRYELIRGRCCSLDDIFEALSTGSGYLACQDILSRGPDFCYYYITDSIQVSARSGKA